MPKIRLWSEFVPFKKLESLLDLIKSYDIEPSIALNENEVSKSKDLLRKLYQKGIDCSIWPTLEKGYFVNPSTVTSFVRYLHSISRLLKENTSISTIVFDLEPPINVSKKSIKINWNDPKKDILRSKQKAQNILQQLVEEIQDDWKKYVLTTEPYGLNFDLPIPTNAKRHSILAYSSFIPKSKTNYINQTIEYGKRNYGKNVEIDLGATSPGILANVPGLNEMIYRNPDRLTQEIRILKQNSIQKIGVYALDGMLNDTENWFKELTRAWNI